MGTMIIGGTRDMVSEFAQRFSAGLIDVRGRPTAKGRLKLAFRSAAAAPITAPTAEADAARMAQEVVDSYRAYVGQSSDGTDRSSKSTEAMSEAELADQVVSQFRDFTSGQSR